MQIVPLPAKRKIPPVPQGLLPSVRRSWRVFWESSIPQVLNEVDQRGIRRLFRLYDQHERALEILEKAMLVKGSVGQIRVNPVADLVLKLESAILRLENEFGLTPMARARLGIALGEAHRSLTDLNRAIPTGEVDQHAVSPDDPRLAALDLPDTNG